MKLSITLITFVLFGIGAYSQQTYKGNLILIIDNTLVTNRISINVTDEKSKIIQIHGYLIGNEIELLEVIFDTDIYLEFDYIGKDANGFKKYHYKIPFSKGYLDNTSYLILRVFNLDKQEYKDAFCETREDYAFEFQNQVYYQSNIQCTDFIKF